MFKLSSLWLIALKIYSFFFFLTEFNLDVKICCKNLVW